jgi:hypothetical protein
MSKLPLELAQQAVKRRPQNMHGSRSVRGHRAFCSNTGFGRRRQYLARARAPTRCVLITLMTEKLPVQGSVISARNPNSSARALSRYKLPDKTRVPS